LEKIKEKLKFDEKKLFTLICRRLKIADKENVLHFKNVHQRIEQPEKQNKSVKLKLIAQPVGAMDTAPTIFRLSFAI
jgi:hypothetical protein